MRVGHIAARVICVLAGVLAAHFAHAQAPGAESSASAPASTAPAAAVEPPVPPPDDNVAPASSPPPPSATPPAVDPTVQPEQTPAPVAPAGEPPPQPPSAVASAPTVASDSADSEPLFVSRLQVHGFASEGGFVSTANDYIGASSRGSLKFFDIGINISTDLTERLHVGMQFVSRSVGVLSEDVPRLDWGFLDFRGFEWLGVRAGVIRLPLGLYNEYVDIDSARTAILLPQSIYPIRNRDALISQIGFALYGSVPIGVIGVLDYQAWLGTLTIPRSALELKGARLDTVDTKYVTGGQLFWRTPLDGLRVGVSYLRAAVDFNLTFDPEVIQQLVMAGLLKPDADGSLVVTQDPAGFWVGSAEYIVDRWLFAFEYSRWLKHQTTSLPMAIPTLKENSERFYGMVTCRLSSLFELGAYYSLLFVDPHDRSGHGARFSPSSNAFQRDLAASVRLDVNEHWLWKLEGHFIDGTADLDPNINTTPKRRWGLFLFRTTVTF